MLLTFEGRRVGDEEKWGSVSPFLVEIAGDQITAPQPVPGNNVSITYPTVAGDSQGGAFVAWTERTEKGANQIVMARGRR